MPRKSASVAPIGGAAQPNAVELSGVSKVYRAETGVAALRDLTLRIETGALVAVMGASGSGKSTLLNLIGGLDTPSSGSIVVGGTDLATLSETRRSVWRRHHVSFVFQAYHLLSTLTCAENVALPLHLQGRSRREVSRMVAAELAAVGLTDRASHLPDELSGGDRQGAHHRASAPPGRRADRQPGHRIGRADSRPARRSHADAARHARPGDAQSGRGRPLRSDRPPDRRPGRSGVADMTFLLRTVSRSYLTRHYGKTLFAVLGIAVGVATFVSVRTAQQTLVAGFRSTVDRLAGRAQIQITGVGGVPEALLETLRSVPEVDVAEPVIEQVVTPEPAALGTLLVMAVDLVGDHALRDYAFAGDDADVEDPLVFLAQPDSVALSREFAGRAAVRIGDHLDVRAGGVSRQLRIRALIEPRGFARAYGGNIAITDVYAAQALFGRGRRFDRIDLRLGTTVALDEGLTAVGRAVGPGYQVETPARRGSQVERLVGTFLSAFTVLGVVALGIGLFIIFNVFSVAVERRRRDIGILRAVGATPRQVRLLFLCEAGLLGAIGGGLGILLGTFLAGRFLTAMAAAVAAAYGLSETGAPAVGGLLTTEALIVAVGASLVGAWLPAREAARVPPTSALAAGVFSVRSPVAPWQAPLGVALFFIAYATSHYTLLKGTALLAFVCGCCAAGTSFLAGAAARAGIRPLAPVLAAISPVAGRIAADSLRGRGRRTAGTAAVLTISMAFVLGMAGYLQAVRTALGRWVSDAMTADLIVRASAGFGPSPIRLPAELQPALLEIPGIRSADGYRNERTPYRDREVSLVAIDARGFAARTRHTFVAGDDTAFRVGLPDRGQCVVSDNFSRRFGQGVGDVVALDSPTGVVHLPIAAVVVNFVSERGTVMIDRSLFADRWRSDRVDAYHVTLSAGADPSRVRAALGARLASGTPALISTRAEFMEEVDAALGSLQVLINAVVLMALAVALMAVTTSLWVSVMERSRDIGILKALGVRHVQIAASVAWEAVTLACVSLAIAIPVGSLLAWFLRTRVASDFRFPAAYPVDTLLVALVALPFVAIIAAWMPARWAVGLNVAEAIAYE